jgi:hypothetical protein
MSLVNFYKQSGFNKPVSIRVRVRLNSVPYDGATVTGTIGGINVTLISVGSGTGYYSLCSFGSFNGSSVTANLTATISTGDWVSVSGSSSQTSFVCT